MLQVITDARFNPKEYTRLQPDEAPEILWHCFGRNTFRTRRLSHFSSYFTVLVVVLVVCVTVCV